MNDINYRVELNKLGAERMALGNCTDPKQWRELAEKYHKLGALNNYSYCMERAMYYEKMSNPG